LLLSNGTVVFALHGEEPGETPPETWLREFLSPSFQPCQGREPHFSVLLRPFSALPAAWQAGAAQVVQIRRSSAEAFNLQGKAGALPDGSRVVVDERNRTAYHFTDRPDRVVIYWSERSRIHLLEFARYTSLLVEEALATALLHASAATDESGCYLVVGAKGAGKTTTLFHLVQDHGLQHFSGDKVLLSLTDGQPRARSWPDYPHIGVGTFARFPELARRCGIRLLREDGTPRTPTDKELVDPALFRLALPPAGGGARTIRAIVFPQVGAQPGQAHLVPVEDRSGRALEPFLEYPHEFAVVHWHRMLEPIRLKVRAAHTRLLDALAEVPWIRLQGNAELPADLIAACGAGRSRN
jgi:hypothetical protein